MFPAIRAAKFGSYNLGTKFLGRPLEAEFKLLSRFGPVRLALDIGGNWGQSIVALKRVVNPRKIVSFEPNSVLAERLARKFSADQSVEIKELALSDREGEFTLYIPIYMNYVYDGLASLNIDEARCWFTSDRFAFFKPSRLRIEKVAVRTATLDSLQVMPDVVKMDVQGAEAKVLAGGLATFREAQPITIMECPSTAVVAQMATFGLEAYYFDGRALLDWRLHHSNVIFMTKQQKQALASPNHR
jgi:FkbM family methyltransferase